MNSLRATERRNSWANDASMEQVIMEDVTNDQDQAEGDNTSDILATMGMDSPNDSMNESDVSETLAKDDPEYVIKKRLGMQAKKHQREMRALREEIARMQATQGNRGALMMDEVQNPTGQPIAHANPVDDQIERAVRRALEAKNAEERMQKEAKMRQHIQEKYINLDREFDKASDKYDDFDDVVRAPDVPFTKAMQDALLLVDNPAEVAYKLGKNREELSRIAELHPLDQAREINKLSFALMGITANSPASQKGQSRPMAQMKTQPVNSTVVTDKTPPSVIRARMKAGTWK